MKSIIQRVWLVLFSCSVFLACSPLTPEVISTASPAPSSPTAEDLATLPVTDSPSLPTSTATPDLAATAEALATPTEEPFQLPGGRLLLSVTEQDQNTDGFWAPDYFVVNLADLAVERHPQLIGEDPIRDRLVKPSPDYRFLAVARQVYGGGEFWYSQSSTTVYLFGSDQAEPIQVTQPLNQTGVRDMSWSLDGRFLAFVAVNNVNDRDYTFYVYDVQSGALKKLPIQTSEAPADIEMSPTGDRIAYAYFSNAGLDLVNVDGTNPQHLHDGQLSSLQWHPDGTQLFFQQLDEVSSSLTIAHIYRYDLASGAAVPIGFDKTTTAAFFPVLSPDGRLLVYGSDTQPGGLFVVDTAGGVPVKLFGGTGFGLQVWSPDSQYLAYTGPGGILIMDSQGHGQVKVYEGLPVLELIAWLP